MSFSRVPIVTYQQHNQDAPRVVHILPNQSPRPYTDIDSNNNTLKNESCAFSSSCSISHMKPIEKRWTTLTILALAHTPEPRDVKHQLGHGYDGSSVVGIGRKTQDDQ